MIYKKVLYDDSMGLIGYIKYTDDPNDSFIFHDIKGTIESKRPALPSTAVKIVDEIEYCEILDIIVDFDHRGKGIGAGLLKEVIDSNRDKLIFLTAGASKRVYHEPIEDPTMLTPLLKKLSTFYERNGFINVNDVFGGYEFKVSYLYNNDVSQKILGIANMR